MWPVLLIILFCNYTNRRFFLLLKGCRWGEDNEVVQKFHKMVVLIGETMSR